MSATNNQREMILKWHKGKAATPEYTAKLLSVPLDEVLYHRPSGNARTPQGRFHTRIHRTITLNSGVKNETLHQQAEGTLTKAPS